MTIRNSETTYGSVAKFFHWTIFILVLLMLCAGYFLHDVPKDYQPVTYNLHKLTGLTILLLMTLRLLWAAANPKPALPAGTQPWQRWAERLVHGLLYLVVIAMPLAGWMGSCAAGRPPHLGSWVFNLPVEKNKDFSEAVFEVHGMLAIAIMVLVSLHIVAALYHHYVKKDDILRRMLPH